jgi:hypothetical protein
LLRQFQPAAVECRLDATHSRTNQFSDFFEGVIKNVLQQYAGSLLRRERQDEVLDCPAYIPPSRFDRLHEVGRHDRQFRFLANASAAQQIDATVVRDSEQPWREREAIIELIELSIGLEQSLLNDILAV